MVSGKATAPIEARSVWAVPRASVHRLAKEGGREGGKEEGSNPASLALPSNYFEDREGCNPSEAKTSFFVGERGGSGRSTTPMKDRNVAQTAPPTRSRANHH